MTVVWFISFVKLLTFLLLHLKSCTFVRPSEEEEKWFHEPQCTIMLELKCVTDGHQVDKACRNSSPFS